MLDSVDYETLLQYSPKSASEISKKSREVRDAVKGGRIEYLKNRVAEIISENTASLKDFLNNQVTLVPVPRSSPIRDADLWPAFEIAKMLSSLNLGTIETCLKRDKAVRKSALQTAENRPSIEEHFNSMSVRNVVPSANITMIDDVLTQGRTSLAAASRIAEKYPNVTVRVFCLLQSKGFGPEIQNILNIEVGKITYNPATGKCRHTT